MEVGTFPIWYGLIAKEGGLLVMYVKEDFNMVKNVYMCVNLSTEKMITQPIILIIHPTVQKSPILPNEWNHQIFATDLLLNQTQQNILPNRW